MFADLTMKQTFCYEDVHIEAWSIGAVEPTIIINWRTI